VLLTIKPGYAAFVPLPVEFVPVEFVPVEFVPVEFVPAWFAKGADEAMR
jgi:hypothetical protein